MARLKRYRLARVLGRVLVSDVGTFRSEAKRLGLRARRRTAIKNYLSRSEVRKLHVGAGHNVLDGWLNSDVDPQEPGVIHIDITEPLPFEPGSIDLIFSEHLIEHIPHADALLHLKDCLRVLRPGGRMRIATPNLRFLIDMYVRPEATPTEQRYVKRTIENAFPESGFEHPAFVLNNFMRQWGHAFIYDETTLAEQLRAAGFMSVRRWPVYESDDAALQGLEHHGDAISEEFNIMQTLVLEGTRPQGSTRPPS